MMGRLFNWKRYPASVFLTAIPCELLGFSSMAAFAWLQWTTARDPVYAMIFTVGMLVLVVALLPALRMYRAIQALGPPRD